MATEAAPDSSFLLDMTPDSQIYDWRDPALEVGESYADSEAGVTISPVSVGSNGAAVSVTLGPSACTRATPTVALSPSQSQWVQAGTPVTYTVSVTNHDNGECSASSFTL